MNASTIRDAIAGRGESPVQAAERRQRVAERVARIAPQAPPPEPSPEALAAAPAVREAIKGQGPSPAARQRQRDARARTAGRDALEQALANVELSDEQLSAMSDDVRQALGGDAQPAWQRPTVAETFERKPLGLSSSILT